MQIFQTSWIIYSCYFLVSNPNKSDYYNKAKKRKKKKETRERQNKTYLPVLRSLSVESACGFSPPFLGFLGFLFVPIKRRKRERDGEEPSV